MASFGGRRRTTHHEPAAPYRLSIIPSTPLLLSSIGFTVAVSEWRDILWRFTFRRIAFLARTFASRVGIGVRDRFQVHYQRLRACRALIPFSTLRKFQRYHIRISATIRSFQIESTGRPKARAPSRAARSAVRRGRQALRIRMTSASQATLLSPSLVLAHLAIFCDVRDHPLKPR